MNLIIGLGNIGKQYIDTRHNIGFQCLDRYAQKIGCRFHDRPLYEMLQYRDSLLIKPKTYMNRSGLALQDVMARYNIVDVLAVYDDIELELGDLRIRNGGGDGGHNGVKSLLDYIASVDLKRIRIGIGRDEQISPEKYVLGKFTEKERSCIDLTIDKVIEMLDNYVDGDFKQLLDKYSLWKRAYSDTKISESLSKGGTNNG